MYFTECKVDESLICLSVPHCVYCIVYDRHKIHQPKVGARIKSQIGEYWLKSAQVARKAGQLQVRAQF